MRKKLVLTTIFAFSVLTTNYVADKVCCPAYAEDTNPYADEYTLISDKLSLNFGTLKPNETKYDAVTLINNGNEDITISDMITEGDGFFIKENNCPSTLAPNDRCVVVIGFSSDKVGEHNGDFKVFTERHSVDVSLTATVIKQLPKVEINKDSIDFGNVKLNEVKYDAVTISNTGEVSVPIRDIEIEGEGFSIKENTCSDLKSLEPNQECSVIVAFEGKKIGSYEGNLKIFLDNLTFPVKLSGNVVGKKSFTVSNTDIDFGIIPTGEEKKKTVYLVNDGDVPITIIGVEGIEEPYSVSINGKLVLNPKDSVPVDITFNPKDEGEYDYDLKLLTDNATLYKVIHLKGRAATNDIRAVYFADKDKRIFSIDFGSVFLMNRKEKTVVINNPTLNELKINKITAPEGFEVSMDKTTIPAFSNATLKVAFTPNEKKAYSGKITLLTDNNRELSIPVYGKGTDFYVNAGDNNSNNIISYEVEKLSLFNKPQGAYPVETFGFTAYNVKGDKLHIKLNLYAPYNTPIKVYKITRNGNWVELPFNPQTKVVEYDVEDNSQLDWNMEKGIITDPIVVATVNSPSPVPESGNEGGNGGGGCSMAIYNPQTGLLNLLLPFFGILPFFRSRRKKK